MSPIPGSFETQGITVWADPHDPSRFYYIPGEPSPELDPAGRPALILLVSDQGALIQLGAHWAVTPEKLAALQAQIQSLYPDLDPQTIRLAPAPIEIQEASLSRTDAVGETQTLGSTTTSGYPPYTALFNTGLTAEQKSAAISSLHGKAGILAVTYCASLAVPAPISTTIQGDARTDLLALGSDASLEACLARVETALLEGRLQIVREQFPGSSEALRQEVDSLAMQKAAELFQAMSRAFQPGWTSEEAALEASAVRTEIVNLPIERRADLADWFPDGSGGDHIRVASVTIESPAGEQISEPATVALDFDPGDAPVAFVQLQRDGMVARLSGPAYQPVTLAGGAGPIQVQTFYTDGGPAYQTSLDEPGEKGWQLAPEHLGLARVSVDARGRKEAGIEEIRLHVLYRPAGQGSEDDRILYLKDEAWTAAWYVVSRSSGLEGALEYDWKETAADGSVNRFEAETSETPEIELKSSDQAPGKEADEPNS